MENVVEQLLGPLGLTVALIFTIFAHFRGWWVRGKDYEKLEKEKDEWKDAALRGISTAERVVNIHEAERRDRSDGPLR